MVPITPSRSAVSSDIEVIIASGDSSSEVAGEVVLVGGGEGKEDKP